MIDKEIKAVIFDVDNTLIASNDFVVKNITKTVDRLIKGGFSVSKPTKDDIYRIQAKNLPFEDIFKELFLGVSNGQELWEVVLGNYREHSPSEKYDPTSGSLEAIKSLKQAGLVVGLVTNRVRMLSERLAQAGFDIDDFAFMHIPPELEFRKPHPRAFEEAIKHLENIGIKPEQTVMFGDHSDDYYSSFYQKIKFVGVCQGQTTREDFHEMGIEDALIVKNLENIENILEEVIKVDRYKKSLQSTSALDGRHGEMTAPLRHYFSEYALHKYRVKAEIEHLLCLSDFFDGQVVRLFTPKEKEWLKDLADNFSESSAYEVLQYDHLGRNGVGPVEHDMKACELWIKEKMENTSLSDVASFVHMFTTSADINNLAYKMMLNDGMSELFVPSVLETTEVLKSLSEKYKNNPLLARTHVQPASPTTFGKVFANYLVRLTNGLQKMQSVKLTGKINGAVGNYNSFVSAYPDLDWIKYSKELTKRLNLECELWTDQRGTHVDMISKLQAVQEVGNVLRDIAVDMSLYAGFGTMYFTKVESHVGSSVMPHKINPWFAEVAEGNIKKANALFNVFSSELDVSRLQRDLSDHDLEKSYGEAIGYVYVALKHLQIAFDLIRPNVEFAREEINNNPQIITEAIQTILRKYGRIDAYEIVKKESRGKQVTLEDLRRFVTGLDVEDVVKQEILTVLHPEDYIGLAVRLVDGAIDEYFKYRQNHLNVL
ncbi:MAG: HAD hydrolase-like protein [Candidatus Magasanikbacteria bacterium]|jgi:adenylosuccinate lyase|nr:HAD hydrolase-like protein [Candidatus Magasanikbacteria bacterium]MBT4315169.1 HAD hydrolase-like protein [Candidatus Magasanikbacteria bacterium]MBT4547375.1 HAD hydrolase-like protein [Candidatus Magasanikbacteria bacterium]MBT6819024.1 HAD hydrolase-like protein [Candidatus Magasanikbacteria bacterium]